MIEPIKKKSWSICSLQETHFRPRDTYRQIVELEKDISCKRKWGKKRQGSKTCIRQKKKKNPPKLFKTNSVKRDKGVT